ncbi:hypothetical protein LCGC14_0336360 [marine sediment metagenome]|uniref:Phage gp6-like head-tail connector protein n=1 Tax=marine sediment metagenome TaxID=412755 RepID=A0A0F9W2A4_9ZZZZ
MTVWIQRSSNTSRTQPDDEPVTVDEVKSDLKMRGINDYDGHIKPLIQAATQYVEEQRLWKALLTQTCIDKFDDFGGEFELAWEPVQSITSITYQDTDNATQTLATSVYELATRNGAGIVRLKFDQVWPVALSHPDSITMTYVAGFGDDAADVPVSIRQAIRVLAGDWQLNPDGDTRIPIQVDGLLSGQAAMRILA